MPPQKKLLQLQCQVELGLTTAVQTVRREPQQKMEAELLHAVPLRLAGPLAVVLGWFVLFTTVWMCLAKRPETRRVRDVAEEKVGSLFCK